MRKFLALSLAIFLGFTTAQSSPAKRWSLNATAIEACTCPMFCQCYFNDKPAGHAGHGDHDKASHFCKFNNAYKINKGHAGNVKLDGAKFWISGDLGSEFSDGEMEWAHVTFDKATTKEQREAIGSMLPHLFPVKWKSLTTGEGDIAWKATGKDAHASIDGGKTAEVKLHAATTSNKPGPIVVSNLKYWGAPRNDGFIMMPNEVQAYRVGEKAYESRGSNGFMITIDMNSTDVKK